MDTFSTTEVVEGEAYPYMSWIYYWMYCMINTNNVSLSAAMKPRASLEDVKYVLPFQTSESSYQSSRSELDCTSDWRMLHSNKDTSMADKWM